MSPTIPTEPASASCSRSSAWARRSTHSRRVRAARATRARHAGAGEAGEPLAQASVLGLERATRSGHWVRELVAPSAPALTYSERYRVYSVRHGDSFAGLHHVANRDARVATGILHPSPWVAARPHSASPISSCRGVLAERVVVGIV